MKLEFYFVFLFVALFFSSKAQETVEDKNGTDENSTYSYGNSTISAIESVKKLLKYAEKNPSEKEEKLSECISKLSDAQSDLEMKIRRYVNEIEKVDNRTGMAFFVRAKVDIGKVYSLSSFLTCYRSRLPMYRSENRIELG